MICDISASVGNHFAKLSDGNGGFKLDIGLFKKGWCGHDGSRTNWADINGDGNSDMLCDDSEGQHWAMLSNGDGTFTDLGRYNSGFCRQSRAITNWADIDGDGKADIICDDSKGRHWIMLSNGDGSFKADLGRVKKGWCGHRGATTSWADINGDGKADMICDDLMGSHWAMLSAGDGTFLRDVNNFKTKWCKHEGSYTQWADLNGDGKYDMMCDDSSG